MPSPLYVLAGLAAGLALGLVAAASGTAWLQALAVGIEPAGVLFVNAVRMTVIPLVVSKLMLAVAATEDRAALGRLGARTLAVFLLVLGLAGTFSALVGYPLMQKVPLDPATLASMQQAPGAREGAPEAVALDVSEWIVSLVPTNPVQAAADAAMLPLIVFGLLFGLALSHVVPVRRDTAIHLLEAVADAMIVIVRWVLRVAPIGVFALAAPLAVRLGFGVLGALAAYVVVVLVACVGFSALVLYPAATVFGRLSPWRFATAITPAQSIALSSRSSLASLPVMIEASRERLKLDERVTGFVLPLAVSILKVGTVMALVVASLFLARLYGVHLAPLAVVSIVITSIAMTLGSPGVPSGGILVVVPVLSSAGIPVEGVGLLLAMDVLPDMIRTTTNITADMAIAAVLDPPTRNMQPQRDTGPRTESSP